jgi:hypothetical protein
MCVVIEFGVVLRLHFQAGKFLFNYAALKSTANHCRLTEELPLPTNYILLNTVRSLLLLSSNTYLLLGKAAPRKIEFRHIINLTRSKTA